MLWRCAHYLKWGLPPCVNKYVTWDTGRQPGLRRIRITPSWCLTFSPICGWIDDCNKSIFNSFVVYSLLAVGLSDSGRWFQREIFGGFLAISFDVRINAASSMLPYFIFLYSGVQYEKKYLIPIPTWTGKTIYKHGTKISYINDYRSPDRLEIDGPIAVPLRIVVIIWGTINENCMRDWSSFQTA